MTGGVLTTTGEEGRVGSQLGAAADFQATVAAERYLTYAANVSYSLLHVRSFIAFNSWQSSKYSYISVSTDLGEYLRALNLHSDRQTERNK
jgi:hypothetical protein